MCLRLRQPSIVEMLRFEAAVTLRKQLADQPEEYERLADETDPPTLIEWTETRFPGLIENVGMSFFAGLVDNEKIGTEILRLQWALRSFPDTDWTLLLGDHPCIFTGGIDDPDLVIALPISPRKAFFAIRGKRAFDRIRVRNSRELIKAMNESTVGQSRIRVYATDSTPLRFISNYWNRRKPVREGGSR